MMLERKLRWIGLMIVHTAIAIMLSGCTLPQQTSAVVANNANAAGRVAISYTQDAALLRDLLASQLASQRTMKHGDIHREIIVSGYINASTNAPAPDILTRDIANPQVTTSLVREVRLGRISADQAQRWLADYAASYSLSDSRAHQDSMVDSFGDMIEFNDAADTLLSQFDAHMSEVNTMLGEVSQGNQAIIDFLSRQNTYDWRAIGSATAPVVTDALFAHVSDPVKRQAATDLLAAILKPLAPTTK